MPEPSQRSKHRLLVQQVLHAFDQARKIPLRLTKSDLRRLLDYETASDTGLDNVIEYLVTNLMIERFPTDKTVYYEISERGIAHLYSLGSLEKTELASLSHAVSVVQHSWPPWINRLPYAREQEPAAPSEPPQEQSD